MPAEQNSRSAKEISDVGIRYGYVPENGTHAVSIGSLQHKETLNYPSANLVSACKGDPTFMAVIMSGMQQPNGNEPLTAAFGNAVQGPYPPNRLENK